MEDIELEGAEELLDLGVSLPLRAIKIPFSGRVIRLRATMRRPRMGGRLRICRHYLKLGVTYEQVMAFTPEEDMAFMAQHGRRLSKMVALTICRGFISGWLFTPLMAFVIRWFVEDEFTMEAQRQYLSLLGTKSFSNIIRSAQMMNLMSPRLSQKGKGS